MNSEFAERQKNDFFRDITSFASLWWFLIISLLFLITKEYDIFSRLFFGLLLIYAIVVLIRSFYFKQRPQKYAYDSYIEKLDASSFPSLHAARSAFMSFVLMKFFNNAALSAILAVLVILIAYSRIHLKKHDLTDVLAGVFVGISVYFAVGYVL